MKSNKILGLLFILFAVHVWSCNDWWKNCVCCGKDKKSKIIKNDGLTNKTERKNNFKQSHVIVDPQHIELNLNDTNEIHETLEKNLKGKKHQEKNYEQNPEFQSKYNLMKTKFKEVNPEKILSLLNKKFYYDENLEPNTKKNEKNRDLMLDLSTYDDIKWKNMSNMFEVWSYIVFPIIGDFSITGKWEDVKYFQFHNDDYTVVKSKDCGITISGLNDDDEIMICRRWCGYVYLDISIENVQDGIKLDPDYHRLPNYISNLNIIKSNIISLQFRDTTNIDKLSFVINDETVIFWENIHLPKVTKLEIRVSHDSSRFRIQEIENIHNAEKVENLILKNIHILKLDLRIFKNLKELNFENCHFKSQKTEIHTLKETKKSFDNEFQLNHDQETGTYTY